MTNICQTVTTSFSVRVARRIIRQEVMAWETIISRRWSNLSAATPPNRFKMMAGIPLARPTEPTARGEPVNWKISQNWPNLSIWNPLTDARLPSQNQR